MVGTQHCAQGPGGSDLNESLEAHEKYFPLVVFILYSLSLNLTTLVLTVLTCKPFLTGFKTGKFLNVFSFLLLMYLFVKIRVILF